MTQKRSSPSKLPKVRADAQRNRDRILEVAREVFTRSGADASLDEIARQAGVGPGTLYRHFPAREELLKAVYRKELETLATAGKRFADTLSPVEALRAWFLLFVDAVAAKQIIAPALSTLLRDHEKVFEDSYTLVQEALRNLVKRGVKSGDIRKDLDPGDLLRALVGVAHVPSSPDWQPSARRLVDILIAGSRPLQPPRERTTERAGARK
jgi:AcrR family transcriptional regulator